MSEMNVITTPVVTAASELETWRLEYVSTSQVRLGMLGGTGTTQRGIITIDGATYTFSSAPVGSNSGIGNDTSRYVYVRDVAGTLTFSFEATAPTTQVPGAYAVKTGDAARRYVGKIRTDGSGNFTVDAVWSASKRFYSSQRLVNDLRLSCSNTDTAPTSNQTAITTIYLCPDVGNRISLYNTTSLDWEDLVLSANLSLSLSGLTADRNFDVFAYGDSGKVRVETLIWSDAVTRGTALVRQDGVWCKTGDLSRRYVGTFRTTGSVGTTEDSDSKRFLYNQYNRRRRKLYAADTGGSHTYNSASYRIWNSTTTAGVTQVLYVIGDPSGQIVPIEGGGWIAAGTPGAPDYILALGLNTTSSAYSDARFVQKAVGNFLEGHFLNEIVSAAGLSTVSLLEYANASAGSFQIGTMVGSVQA